MNNSLVEENYLKTLFTLSNHEDGVNVKELSDRLGIKMPTVTSMMRKLSTKGLVHYESYKPLKLTEKGMREAALIIRKHRLTEMFLVEKMGFGWEEVHEIAEQVEHVRSSIFFDKMDEILGYPKLDPHGSPIPDKEGNMEWKSYRKLSECKKGETIRLSAVVQASNDFLKFLNSKNLKLNMKVTIQFIENFDGSMLVSYENHPAETLSHTVCERLLVE